ncbi:MAG: glycosyltransferase family 4 protein [Coleofasciculaceae cyanobacterium SM2_1_6]|nr:glycosyltransferase family 4 protein [Coleofasciculaceae cyanobacterium SM2_1_6]
MGNQGSRSLSRSLWGTIAIQNYHALAQELQLFTPDVCLAGNLDFLGSAVAEQILAAGIPIAHYVMNGQPGYPSDLVPSGDFAKNFYQYITVSDWICRNLTDNGYPTTTAQTIYPGAEVEQFYQAELPPRDQLRIVYAGLVMHYKGTDVLTEALYLLHQEGIDFTATIAGGSLTPDFVDLLKDFINEEGLAEKVQFTGLLDRQGLRELYKTHNVWVLPSRFNEPFSIGLVEAMVAGLTIVASDTGGSPEAILPQEGYANEHRLSGLIFESENALDLADNLSFLTLNPDQWEAMTRRGQQRGLTEFSRTRTIEQLEALLQKLHLAKQAL